jgi:membrane protein DedA with SNARE-associated domain
MNEQLISGITQYGYLAIIALIFLQEVGIPSPIPNEFILLFSGYLSFSGILKASLVILSAIIGDLLASVLLFELFYFFGDMILQRKPKWLPLSQEKMERISHRINRSGQTATFIGRLTPFIKGYVSVLCGLLHLSHKKYGVILITTSIIWSSAYVCCGFYMGPYWNQWTQNNPNLPSWFILIPVSMIMLSVLIPFVKKWSPVSK